jgi:hypothetical protein
MTMRSYCYRFERAARAGRNGVVAVAVRGGMMGVVAGADRYAMDLRTAVASALQRRWRSKKTRSLKIVGSISNVDTRYTAWLPGHRRSSGETRSTFSDS